MRPNFFCIPAINTVFPVCTKMIAIANHKKRKKKPKREMNQRKDTTPFYRFHTGVTFTWSYFCLFVLSRKKNESNVGVRKIISDRICQDVQFSHTLISCRNYKIKSKSQDSVRWSPPREEEVFKSSLLLPEVHVRLLRLLLSSSSMEKTRSLCSSSMRLVVIGEDTARSKRLFILILLPLPLA